MEDAKKLLIDSYQELRWQEDVISSNDFGTELFGKIMTECFKHHLIFEIPDSTIKYYYDRKNLDSLEAQCVGKTSTTQKVSVYKVGEEAYVSVQIDKKQIFRESRSNDWIYFTKLKLTELIVMLQPNNTEIFEGKVKKYDINTGGTHLWYELLSNWLTLDDIGEKFEVSVIRSRFLILSKLGYTNGYLLRQEMFEEVYGEVRILVYGLLDSGAINYKVDRNAIFDLLPYADKYVEKDKIEALDTQSIAYMFSDRLEVSPSKNWQHFLNHGELLPHKLYREVTLKLRKTFGPGRFVGRTIINIGNKKLLMSFYEIDNDTSSHELRVVLYEMKHCQTVEFRISPMERLMLFRDDLSLVAQIVERLRCAYCDINIPNRSLIIFDEHFVPVYKPFEINGSEEYDIITNYMQDDSIKFEESHISSEEASLNMDSQSEIEEKVKMVDWAWVVYFNRGMMNEIKGNLIISLSLSTTKSGFIITVFDQRSCIEIYYFLTLLESCNFFYDKTFESLVAELDNLDESVLFDLLDELINIIDIQKNDEDGMLVMLTSEKDDVNDLIIANLKEHQKDPTDVLAKKTTGVPINKVTVEIIGANDLSSNGIFSSRFKH